MQEKRLDSEQEARTSPDAPTGFNHTTHNRNNAARKQGKHCGRYTLIGAKDGQYRHHRFRCKSYTCARCGPKKIRMVRKRIAQHAVKHSLNRFLTLTLDPKKLKAEYSLKEKIAFLSATWAKMRTSLRRMLGKPLVFIAVLELQGNGNPHLHLLVGSYLPKEWVSRAWQAVGGGWSTRIEYADVHRVSAYLAKYFTDDSLSGLPPGTRRFSTSKGLALFERRKSDGSWVLTALPIEFWRANAEEVSTEEFDSEQEGARSLATFVSLRAPAPLVARLSPGAIAKLWVEVQCKRAK